MYHCTIERKGRPIEEIISTLPKRVKWGEAGLNRIHKQLLAELRDYIDAHRKRDKEKHNEAGGITPKSRVLTQTNNLINVINACSRIYKTAEGYSFSIGESRFLNQYAPYWYLINFGGKVPNAGEFIPGYFGRHQEPGMYRGRLGNLGRGEAFHYTGALRGYHPGMKPMKPIAPMYYLNFLARRFREEINGLTKDSLDFTYWKGA